MSDDEDAIRAVVIGGATYFGLLFGLGPASATPTLYVFQQTSTSVPGFFVTGSITIDGTFADIPSLDQFSTPPLNFAPILALDLVLDGFDVDLARFTLVCGTGVPDCEGAECCFGRWSIDGGGIFFY